MHTMASTNLEKPFVFAILIKASLTDFILQILWFFFILCYVKENKVPPVAHMIKNDEIAY